MFRTSDGQLYYSLDGLTYIYLPVGIEGEIMAAKLNAAKAIIGAVQSLATAADSAADLEAEYFDVGVWGDDDVAALGITNADLASCITLLQQVNKLMTGQATSPAIYRTTLNKVRRVGA